MHEALRSVVHTSGASHSVGAGDSGGCVARRRDSTVPMGTTLSEIVGGIDICGRFMLLPVTAPLVRAGQQGARADGQASARQDNDIAMYWTRPHGYHYS